METSGADECQARRNGSEEMHSENDCSSLKSVASMDSSSSNLSSSQDVKSNNSHNGNISELVGKSKKAAFSLWTLLHAKVCCMVCFLDVLRKNNLRKI